MPTLIRRAIPRGSLDYFESGMDMSLGDDWYESFKKYQTMVIKEYNKMADEFDFFTVSARLRPEAIQKKLREKVTEFFATSQYMVKPIGPLPAPPQAPATVPATPGPAPGSARKPATIGP